MSRDEDVELTVLLATKNEAANLTPLFESLRSVLPRITPRHEILVIDGHSSDCTPEKAAKLGARVLQQTRPGYGGAVAEGLKGTRGRIVVTLDADLSHDPASIPLLVARLRECHLCIGSRYVRFAFTEGGLVRRGLSRLLNWIYRTIVDLPYRDMSSGFRAYRGEAVRRLELESTNYEILEEILVKLHCEGYRIEEAPIHFHPRLSGSSKARIIAFSPGYLRSLLRLRRLRKSLQAADYDERAFYSRVLPQRWCQQRRYRAIHELLEGKGRTLDLGSGSSVVTMGLPCAVALDPNLAKLRYLAPTGKRGVAARARPLPFADGAFAEVICSRVIEHLSESEFDLGEIRRVLRPSGTLIVVTPDYSRRAWRLTESVMNAVLPGLEAPPRLRRFTRDQLLHWLDSAGFEVEEIREVFLGEIAVRARVREEAAVDPAARITPDST